MGIKTGPLAWALLIPTASRLGNVHENCDMPASVLVVRLGWRAGLGAGYRVSVPMCTIIPLSRRPNHCRN